MFLKTLTLTRGERQVRRVEFRRGLNLVLDETGDESTDSGNSVGKTSLLRAVNYCLGGKIAPLFQDPEFPERVNETVKEYVTRGMTFRLDLETADGTAHVVEREHNKSIRLDDVPYNNTDFRRKLASLLFAVSSARPTARQLLAKYIRISPHEVSNTVRFLDPSTKHQEYDAVFLYLFGFPEQELLEARHKSASIVHTLTKRLDHMKKALSPESRAQILSVLEEQIRQLEAAAESFDVGEGVERELDALEHLRTEVSRVSMRIGEVSARRVLALQTLNSLEATVTTLDTVALREIYDAANIAIPELHRSFEELVEFHNRMVASKVDFVRSQLGAMTEELSIKREKLDALTATEQGVLQQVARKGALVDLSKIQRQLEKLYEDRGRQNALRVAQLELRDELAEETARLADLSQQISVLASIVAANERRFNRYFADFSKRLYGDSFVFALEFDATSTGSMVSPSIANLSGNEGAGKKRAQVSAFDLAYLAFVAEVRPETPRFTLHDRVEDVDSHQLATLFEIADALDGQYIVALLREKAAMAGDRFVNECVILSLSQDDRFFRIEQQFT